MVLALQEKYKGLVRLTYALTLILLVLIVLFVIGFYKGWFGEPGKIYLSPESNQYYLRCADNLGICEESGMTCEEVIIIREAEETKDAICLR